MKQLRVGIIGTGMRSASYLHNLSPELRPQVRVVALADPDEGNCAKFERFFANDFFADRHRPRQYESGAELLAAEELDALIIGSPNHAHTADALLAMPRRIPLLLEKPVAISLEECKQLWAGFVAAGRPQVTVGFVLRYAPFYVKVKELLQEADLGQLLTVDADESLGTALTAYFFGGGSWRRFDHLTGGFIVEKCCHDLDILNWLTGAKAERVYSVARRTHLTPRPKEQRHARFEPGSNRHATIDYGDSPLRGTFRIIEDDSLYEAESDMPDHQLVTIEFDNGILSTFTVCLAQPHNNRRLRIYGSNGALEGDIERSIVAVDKPSADGRESTRQEYAITGGEGGHHGADSVINEAFWRGALGEPTTIKAGIREGLEAVIVGLAAEESKRTGLPVDVRKLRVEVFGDEA
ncbi:MAG: Gfo/Idh/MocA family oxidoreductase [Thermomicrobiales bacterium]